jgi:hypothetical protein
LLCRTFFSANANALAFSWSAEGSRPEEAEETEKAEEIVDVVVVQVLVLVVVAVVVAANRGPFLTLPLGVKLSPGAQG